MALATGPRVNITKSLFCEVTCPTQMLGCGHPLRGGCWSCDCELRAPRSLYPSYFWEPSATDWFRDLCGDPVHPQTETWNCCSL